jgi:hypothetical protein
LQVGTEGPIPEVAFFSLAPLEPGKISHHRPAKAIPRGEMRRQAEAGSFAWRHAPGLSTTLVTSARAGNRRQASLRAAEVAGHRRR